MKNGMTSYGFSTAAERLRNDAEGVMKRFRESATFSRQAALDELAEVWNCCRFPDWDAHGAEPIDRETLRNTYGLIEALPPGYPLPAIGCEPDGHLTLEWYRSPSWLLSVSVSPDGMLYYAALLGDEDPRGSTRFDGEVPETILFLIRRVCAS